MVNINDFSPCFSDCRPEVSVSEKGCKYTGKNDAGNAIRLFHIDGYVIQGTSEKKCDYLILNDTNQKAFYIELKGTDIKKATEQLDNAIEEINGSIGYEVYPRIVFKGSATHALRDSRTITWKNRWKGKAVIQRTPMIESICKKG